MAKRSSSLTRSKGPYWRFFTIGKLHLNWNICMLCTSLWLLRLDKLQPSSQIVAGNRSHLSEIFSRLLTLTLHTFILTQMSLSFPNVEPHVFWSTEWLQYLKRHWERGKSHKCFKICDEYCSFFCFFFYKTSTRLRIASLKKMSSSLTSES